MRIVAGTARGRRLRAPRGRGVRPTTGRVKEAVFSMLESRDSCAGLAVLDLFAGTGGLGIEALSRGAAATVFVEVSRTAAAVIRDNLARAGLRGEVLTMPAARAIGKLAAAGKRFGGVFLDPPYERGWVNRTLSLIDDAKLVHEGGWVVVEHGRREDPAERVGALVRGVHRCYGDTWIALFRAERASERRHDQE
jgi:16S rRNA (guanine966-N2)-methyltransferase